MDKNKQMKKTELIKLADISSSTLAKLSKNENVSMDVILRLCQVLKCDIGDIVEIVEKAKNQFDVNLILDID